MTSEKVTEAEVCRVIESVASTGPLEPHDVLVEHGVDSMTLVNVILTVETAFHTSIPDAMLTLDAFKTPRSITETIRIAQGVASSAGASHAVDSPVEEPS